MQTAKANITTKQANKQQIPTQFSLNKTKQNSLTTQKNSLPFTYLIFFRHLIFLTLFKTTVLISSQSTSLLGLTSTFF